MNKKIILLLATLFSSCVFCAPVVNASSKENVIFYGSADQFYTRISFSDHQELSFAAWGYKQSTFGSFDELNIRVYEDGEQVGYLRITDSSEYRDFWVDLGSTFEIIVVEDGVLEIGKYFGYSVLVLNEQIETTTIGLIHPFMILFRKDFQSHIEINEFTRTFGELTTTNKFWSWDATATVIAWNDLPSYWSTTALVGHATRKLTQEI